MLAGGKAGKGKRPAFSFRVCLFDLFVLSCIYAFCVKNVHEEEERDGILELLLSVPSLWLPCS